MELDYQNIINQIGDLMQVALPLGISLGLCEWAVRFFLDAVFDRFSRRSRTF